MCILKYPWCLTMTATEGFCILHLFSNVDAYGIVFYVINCHFCKNCRWRRFMPEILLNIMAITGYNICRMEKSRAYIFAVVLIFISIVHSLSAKRFKRLLFWSYLLKNVSFWIQKTRKKTSWKHSYKNKAIIEWIFISIFLISGYLLITRFWN